MNERLRPTAFTAVRVLLLAVAAFWLAKNNADADLWGHVRYGRDLLAGGVLPTTDPYSYTAGTHRWYNHEIAAEIVMALLDRLGPWALQTGKTLAGVACVLLCWRTARGQRCGPLAWVVLTAPAVCVMSWGWAPRPQVFGYLFFTLLLPLLDAAARWPNRLAWSAPLMAAWINCHGSHLFGLALLGGCVALWSVTCLWQRHPRHAAAYAAWGLLALAATLLNPYGWEAYWGVYRELGIPRPQVAEWGPLWSYGPPGGQTPAWLLLAFAALALTDRKVPAHRKLVLALVAWQAAAHVRHGVFLSLAAMAWLPGPTQRGLLRLVQPLRRDAPDLHRELARASGERLSATMSVKVALVVAATLAATAPRLMRIEVRRDGYPVDAVRFIRSEGLAGKMVVPFNWGQYVLDACHPKILVSFDGRYGTVYDRRTLDLNFDLWYPDDPSLRYRDPASGTHDPSAILRHLDPDYALVDHRGFPPAAATLEAAAGWHLVYADPLARIYRHGEPPGTVRRHAFVGRRRVPYPAY